MPISPDTLTKYLRPTFIETGSNGGDGIAAALLAGFSRVISVEINPGYFCVCQRRFFEDRRVSLLLGNSVHLLPAIMADQADPATLWLDSHWSYQQEADLAGGGPWSPLMKELAIIAEAPCKSHVILVDDMNCWRKENPAHGFGDADIRAVLMKINPQYRIHYEHGFCENSILVAEPPL